MGEIVKNAAGKIVKNAAGENKGALRSSRKAFAAGIAIAIAVAVLAIIVVSVLEDRFNLRADLSYERYYSISEQTEAVLKDLGYDVDIYTLYTAGNTDERVEELLRAYAAASPRVHVRNVDPVYEPTFTQQFDPEGGGISAGSVILSCRATGQYRILTVYDLYVIDPVNAFLYAMQAEQKITATINYFTTGEITGVRILTGHDEMSPTEMGTLIGILRNLNYVVSAYDAGIADQPLDPEYDILFVAGPVKDLTDSEYRTLKAFLEGGGNAVFLMDRVILDEVTGTNYIVSDPLDNFNSLLMMYDIRLNNDYIIGNDPNMLAGKPTAHVPEMFAHETITKEIINSGKAPVLTDVSSLTLSGGGSRSGILMQTSQNTWAKELTGRSVVIDKEPGDETGPFTVAAVASAGMSNVCVYGTSSFITNTEITRSANRDLIVNTVNSLKKRGDAINIPAKSLIPGRIEIQNEGQSNLLIVTVLVIVPGLIFAFGFITWRSRKRA